MREFRNAAAIWLSVCALSADGETWFRTSTSDTNTFRIRQALGYRAISLSSATQRVEGVWLRDYLTAELQMFVPYDGVQTNVAAMRARGFRPISVAVYNQIPGESYLISYAKDGKESALFTRLSASELAALGVGIPGSRVAWLEVCGAGEDARFAAVLAQDGLAGSLETGLDKAAMELKVASYRDAGYRPVCVVGVAGSSGMIYAANWVQEGKQWTNRFGMTLTEGYAFLSTLGSQKLRPEVINIYATEDQVTLQLSVVAVEDLPPVWTVTGTAESGLEGLDEIMTNAMKAVNCTRAGFALSKNGRLVMSRGYTHHPANVAPTQPTSGFRLASISKTITAVTVMGLIEAGKLQLDDKLGKFIDLSDVKDSRWTNITIRHLLQHRGGWNRDTTFDPLFYDVNISTALHVPLPITMEHIITYMKTRQMLQANPGAVYSYSNFGYLLLGRVIEKVTGQDYQTFVLQNVLAPLGIHSARVGRTARADRLPGEIEYEEGTSTSPSVLSPDRPPAATPYGVYNLENLDSVGLWVFSAEDLVRYGSMFFEKTNCALLYSNSIDLMWSPAPQEQVPPTGWYSIYGCGWVVQGQNRGAPIYVFHDGSLPGTTTFLIHQADGYCWAVLFNTRNEGGTNPLTALNGGLSIINAINAITQWPTNDLFDVDEDGVPDSYELAKFGSLSASDGTADHDGDDLSDAAEWVAMSNPLDAADGPKIGVRTDSGTAQLQVATHGGRVYTLRAISALDENWADSTVLTNFNGDGFIREVPVSTTGTSGFYRLGVSLRSKPLGLRVFQTQRSALASPVEGGPGFRTPLVPRDDP